MADDRLRLARWFAEGIPHNRALGIRVVDMGPAWALFSLPYDDKLVGNPDTGVLHGGAITALLDGASGASVFAALAAWSPIATLDLRIDYLRQAEPRTRSPVQGGLLQADAQRRVHARDRVPRPTRTTRSRRRPGRSCSRPSPGMVKT